MLAKVTGLEAGELVHVIADAHIYDRHVPIVKEIIVNKQFDAPIFKINERTNNFYDFKVDDFSLIDYNYSPLDQKIEVAI